MGIARTADELPRLIDAFQPGLVIVLVGISDVTWQRGVEQWYAREAANGCSEPAAPSPSDFQILRRLSLAMAGRGHAGTSLVRGQLEWHSENLPTIRQRFQQLPEVVPAADPAIVERFTRDLRRIVSEATRHGAAILLLSQPFLWKDDLPQAERARLWFAVRTETGLVRASRRPFFRSRSISSAPDRIEDARLGEETDPDADATNVASRTAKPRGPRR